MTGKNEFVFFDLDHTLYEAFESRKAQIRNIFRKHFDLARFPWSIYFAIREKYRVFDLVYPGSSFHHYWLPSELVALLFGIIKKDLDPKEILSILRRLENKLSLISYRYPRPGAFIAKADEALKEEDKFQNLLIYINELSESRFVRKVALDYETGLKLEVYPHVKEGIKVLKEMGTKCYIATEGSYERQVVKLKKLSILHHFLNRILASEIFEHNRFYRDSLTLIRNAITQGMYWKMYHSKELSEADENISNFWLLKRKEKCFYYVSILNAIYQDPENPETILKTWSSTDLLEPSDHAFDKLIMFGDRIDKDVDPLWRLYGEKVHIIRIKKGRYMNSGINVHIPSTNYSEFSEPGKAIKYLIQIFEK